MVNVGWVGGWMGGCMGYGRCVMWVVGQRCGCVVRGWWLWVVGACGWRCCCYCWWEAKKLAADIKRRAVARVLTDEDLGEEWVGEVLGDVEVAEGLMAGEDCEWGAA